MHKNISLFHKYARSNLLFPLRLIAVPDSEESLPNAMGEAHGRYGRMVTFREGWRGLLWQGRFKSYAMDESYVVAAARYIELNPVRGKGVKKPWEYPWSRARAHVEEKNDGLVKVGPMLAMVGDWEKFLEDDATEDEGRKLRHHERTGRPLGNEHFVMRLEQLTGRMLKKRNPGPKGAGKMENR